MVAPIGGPGACQTVGVSSSGADRRARLRNAHLYFVADRGGLERALDGALRGGADLVQLRDKTATDAEIATAAAWVAERCAAHGALFILNDRPDLAAALSADVAAGATRAVIVRAIANADDPEAVTRALRAALTGGRVEAGRGAP